MLISVRVLRKSATTEATSPPTNNNNNKNNNNRIIINENLNLYVIFLLGVMGGKKERSWCLSHLPGNGCFISHHCSHQGSKQVLIRLYKLEPDLGLDGVYDGRGDTSSNLLLSSSSWNSVPRWVNKWRSEWQMILSYLPTHPFTQSFTSLPNYLHISLPTKLFTYRSFYVPTWLYTYSAPIQCVSFSNVSEYQVGWVWWIGERQPTLMGNIPSLNQPSSCQVLPSNLLFLILLHLCPKILFFFSSLFFQFCWAPSRWKHDASIRI